jgi:hypothetical protein
MQKLKAAGKGFFADKPEDDAVCHDLTRPTFFLKDKLLT